MEFPDRTYDKLDGKKRKIQLEYPSPRELLRIRNPCASNLERGDDERNFKNPKIIRSPAQVVQVRSRDEGQSASRSSISQEDDNPFKGMNISEGLVGLDVSKNEYHDVNFEELEATIGYKFHSRKLLVEAVTHSSCLPLASSCYQRLEFVGDAVLGHLIAKYFFVKYKDLDPGRLTDLKQATVNNENFSRIAVKHKFHLHLQHGSASLQAKINCFVENIQTELDVPGLHSFGLGDFKAPKVLGDILESIAGAVFLDSGLNTEKTWQVFEPLLQPLVTPYTLLKHPVRELQERCQQRIHDLRYDSYRSDHVKFVVKVFVNEELIATAANMKKKMAQKLAARDALMVLKKRDSNAEATAEERISLSSKVADFTPLEPEVYVKRNCKQILCEMCVSNKWSSEYKFVSEVGIPHSRKFTFSVRVLQGEQWSKEYIGESLPSVRRAKDSAAARYLQSLGIDRILLETCST
ncbi:hypothetical protein R1flu_023347 [Riccia fluitans]|uniref:Uncharacterized protein n=1 Tax=Riccia fluitans TaxID=41844 RepID=A0ABD1XRT9_9MARC